MKSVFLSHSGKDKPFVRELFRRLQRDGVSCFFDEESIEWGANFVLTLEQAIDECAFFVVVLSPDFVLSKWAEVERTSATADLKKIMPRFCCVIFASSWPTRLVFRASLMTELISS